MQEIEINQADAVTIAQFLASPAGRRLVEKLYSLRPSLNGKGFEERAVSSGIAEGWERCIDALAEIALNKPIRPDLGQDKFISMTDDMDPNKRPKGKV